MRGVRWLYLYVLLLCLSLAALCHATGGPLFPHKNPSDQREFENVYSNLGKIPVVTPWVSFTPVWTGVSGNPTIGNGSVAGYWRRVGDTIDVQASFYSGTTTTYGSGIVIVALPSPYAIDTTKMVYNGDRSCVGVGTLFTSPSTIPVSVNTRGDSNHFSIMGTSGLVNWSTTYWTAATNNQSLEVLFSVPVSVWK